jgi:pyruvate kinase
MIDTTKKTKIVCTIGPATTSEEMLTKLLKAGMNVMRMNFSHGDFAEHQIKVDNLKKAIAKTGIPAAIFQDLGGPKIRTGEFGTESGRVTIKNGQKFILTTEKVIGDETKVHISYAKLPEEAKVGERIMLDDGKKQLLITEIKGKEITTKVIAGGELKGRRGVNLPDTDLTISSLTPKDKADIAFGLKNKVDFFALSFVRRPSDVLELRAILEKAKSKAGIISKIETPQAIEHIDEIIALSDAIMVARGDLAVEIPAEEVPLAQKMMIKKCNEAGKPVITATQMLESMIKSPVPTRAEVSDVANAILDGTDAIMLSEETTLGDFPLESVKMMSNIAKRVERDELHEQLLANGHDNIKGIGESICSSTVKTADRVKARYIVALTKYGYSARMTSRHRSPKPILVVTPDNETYNKATLSFGCFPLKIGTFKSFDDALDHIKPLLIKSKLASKGDKIVVVSGVPFAKAKESNVLMVETL